MCFQELPIEIQSFLGLRLGSTKFVEKNLNLAEHLKNGEKYLKPYELTEKNFGLNIFY